LVKIVLTQKSQNLKISTLNERPGRTGHWFVQSISNS